jgi:hypothetical protein
MTAMNQKPFDCVSFKHAAQSAIYEHIHDLSADEQIRWFRAIAESGPLAEWVRRVRTAGSPVGATELRVAEESSPYEPDAQPPTPPK